MKKSLLTGAAFVACALQLCTQPSVAADLLRPVEKARAPVAPVYSWTGCHVGAQVGYGLERNRISQETQYTGAGSRFLATSKGNIDSHGMVFGGQIGCDVQFGGWVVGVQGMGLGTNITGISQDPFNGAQFVDQGDPTASPSTAGARGTIGTRIDYLASITGRLGFTAWSPQTLIYIKGGGAWTSVQYDLRDSALKSTNPNVQVFDANPNSPLYTTRFTGWTIGAGYEWAFAANWSAFVEYNYYAFPERTVALTARSTDTFTQMRARPEISTASVGINYRFNLGTQGTGRF